MYTILVIIQVLVAVALVGLILIQHGKGADAGAAFGSGASGTVFGSRGSANFLSRTTAWLATVFFCVSLALAYLVHGQRDPGSSSVVDRVPAATSEIPGAAQPAAPVTGEEKKAPVVPE
ncbi:preprotein translocase subunit SecG [Solimonas flava]|uniref:preprotein translocase subunit SecG n=1 Tax=Solimonas flava TaxID=415849 RepID=UPI0004082E87|nr:preprotein translocase subunit SecG [Solimonas flava]